MKRVIRLLICVCMSLCVLTSCVQPAFAAVGTVSELSASSVTSDYVSVKWSKVSGVSGYRLYRYDYSKGSWSTVKRTTAVSYTDKTVKAGSRYAYRVRAYTTSRYKTTYGDYSPKVYVNTPPEKVTGISTYNVSKNSVTLKWNKSEGATGYIIYQYNSASKTYTREGATAKTYFEIKNVKDVVGSRFRIRSYARINKSYVYGKYSDLYKNEKALANVTDVKVSAVTANSHKLSWKAVEDADGYQILRYDADSKKWKYVKKTSNTNVKFSGYNEGEKFLYRIRAYKETDGKYGYGNYTANITAVTLPSVPKKLTVTENKYKGLTLKWNQVNGATGYLIYSYNSALGKWELLGTTTKNYYYNNNLKETKNYTYRVRAFISVDSVNYYGPFCESVTAFYKVKTQSNDTIAKLEKNGIFGYLYDPAENCFYTSGDPWQRNVGYNEVFDWCAPFTLINFDTERLYFTYKDKDWLVQLWKGQYGLVFYGAEVGVYYKPTDRELAHFDCVNDDDMLKMSLDFYVKSSSGKWSKKFTRPYGEYWWCTGFLAGNIGNRFDRLRYILRVTMKDSEMLKVFKQALNQTDLSYRVDGLDVYIDYK